MAKPVLIFTPGAWHSPEIFNPILSKLKGHGYHSIALPLQAVSQTPAVPDLQPDITAIRSAVLQLDSGNDVMRVAHSWSGIIVSGALDGLSKGQREKEGKKGGVVKLAFLCSFVPGENQPWVTVKGLEELFYHDLPPESQAYWASKLKPHSYATKFIGATSAAWKVIPSSYLICEGDHAIPVAVQEAMVKACKDHWCSHGERADLYVRQSIPVEAR